MAPVLLPDEEEEGELELSPEEPPEDDPPTPSTLAVADAEDEDVKVDELPTFMEDEVEVVAEAGDDAFIQFVLPPETVRRDVEPPV
jgi:hypothetical protein